MKRINLTTTAVENREQRLGTIIGWDGNADILVEESGYARKCAGRKGKACELCEVRGPFTQGSVCSEQMVECQAGNVRDAVLIQHSPIGCAVSQTIYNSIYRNGLAMRNLPVENLKIVSTNLLEKDMVFGGIEKLKKTLDDVIERYQPKAVFIGTSCSTGIIGDDVDSIATEYAEQYRIPVVPLHCEGFRSKHWSTGFDSTQHGILRDIVRKNPQKHEDLVNVINLWGSDVFTPMLKELDLRVNYVIDMATVEDLAKMSEAAATVGFCNTLSSYLAQGLEQNFGVPELKAPQPYGIYGTDAWLRGLAKLTHREELAERYIEKEHARIKPLITDLKTKLQGKKGYVATGSAYSHGLIAVMRELGIEVNGSLVFHHDPVYDSEDPAQDSLAFLVDHYGDVENFSVSNRQQHQFYALLKRVNPDFILIRHNGLAPFASRLGIPAAPLGDEHIAVGYGGIANLGNAILGILQRRKFHEDLSRHVKLPYTNWWLEQTDPYIIARNPELIYQD